MGIPYVRTIAGKVQLNDMMAAQRANPSQERMEYHLYPMVPDFLAEQSVDKFLDAQQDAYLAYLSQYLLGYIWQNEPFRLQTLAPDHETGTGYPEIHGTTDYGDNVEDEWFIVFILRQLTMAFPGLVAKLSDNDGEFLLIEAAEDLPKWLTPDTSENRIYLFDGEVHILPVERWSLQETPKVEEATEYIRENPQFSKASAEIQCHIHRRIAAYPSKAKEQIHRAHCYIPAPLAAILEHTPALVAPIVHAFYLRDPVDLKACVTMQRFQPGTRIMREVKFTRCLYAQLMQQRFKADHRSGFSMPKHSSPKFKAYDLGMKLAHGAEILTSKVNPQSCHTKPHPKAHNLTKRWQHFLKDLTNKGYFRDEVEGSQMYQQLLSQANKYYYTSVEKNTTKEPGLQMLQIMADTSYDLEEMRQQEKHLPPPDDDRWLTVTPAELDQMLSKASGKAGSGRFNMSSIAQSMKQFVSKISSHEGAEIPKGEDDCEVHLDPNSFIQTMQKMFEFEDEEDPSSSDLSEYSSDEEVEVQRRQSKSRPSVDMAMSQEKIKSMAGVGDYLGIKDYMTLMDRELAGSEGIGRTTTSESDVQQSSHSSTITTETVQNGVTTRTTTTTQSQYQATNNSGPVAPPRNKKPPKAIVDEDFDDIDDLDDDFTPVAVDLNVVDNLLQSYNAQQGLPGPTSNLMGSMGIRMHPSNNNDR